MTEASKFPRGEREPHFLPRPVLKKKWLPRLLLWIVPIAAAVLAGGYFSKMIALRGPLIAVRFKNVDGIRIGDTPVQFRGVEIGRVSDIALSNDRKDARVEIRLYRDQSAFARKGAEFWIVRPEASGAGVTGLTTVFSGPYIDSTPGEGSRSREFVGRGDAPIPFEEGLHLILSSSTLEHLTADAPVLYKGVQVGTVHDMQLATTAERVEIHVVVWRRYMGLVRTGSKFWDVSGFNVKGGLFTGVDLQLESLRALIAGAVAFATPEGKDMGGPVKEGAEFKLADEPDQSWSEWSPKIPISPAITKPQPRQASSNSS